MLRPGPHHPVKLWSLTAWSSLLEALRPVLQAFELDGSSTVYVKGVWTAVVDEGSGSKGGFSVHQEKAIGIAKADLVARRGDRRAEAA